jgi:hypothetical protein
MMKRNYPLALIAFGILLSIAAFGRAYRSSENPISTTTTLPKQVVGLELTSTKSGEAAISEFVSMHGKEFPVTSGNNGYYGNGAITIWVAGTSTDAGAEEMVDSMYARIADGNSPFTPIDQFQNVNRTVYVLDGMGQKHFYFQSNSLVIWLAAQPTVAEAAIQQILEDY